MAKRQARSGAARQSSLDDAGSRERYGARFVVFTELLEHRYVDALRACVEAGTEVVYRPWVEERWRIVGHGSSAAFHIQWVDALMVRRSYAKALAGVVRLLGFVVLLRACRVRVVWTVHNPIAKAHRRVTLDRATRAALVLCCHAIVVLGDEVVSAAAVELPAALRGRFRRRAHVVPIPIIDFGHDASLTRTTARQRLGIPTDLSTPLVAYLPGANQVDLTAQVDDPHGRYGLLTIDRSAEPTGLRRNGHRWTYCGRPDDETFGAIISASDAVLLSHDQAFASLTAHAAALLNRPVLSPACAATSELRALGCASTVRPPLSSTSVWSALCAHTDHGSWGYAAYVESHRDELVRAAALAAYGRPASRS